MTQTTEIPVHTQTNCLQCEAPSKTALCEKCIRINAERHRNGIPRLEDMLDD